ncbi:MAG: heme-binding domain-containing protein [Anaerolineae bacterium]|nr:heme-binding domain-containing protein [Anaerolineae bacterium]MDQ7035995.1 heme-binding domain-containing protein [Anaerolineae bacterium]
MIQQFKDFVFNRENRGKITLWVVGCLILGYLVVGVGQFVVLGFPDNPPVEYTVQWDSPRTEELWNRACRDCHSNETVWPWYSYVAPTSMLVVYHVNEGRESLNVSTDDVGEASDVGSQIRKDKMPPEQYIWLHPTAQLTDAEKDELIMGLLTTFR